MNEASLREECRHLGIELNAEQLAAFSLFESDLYQLNATMNLTRVSQEACWVRHFLDSLLIAPLLPMGSRVLDVGTGPGFPAWPLALARPDLQILAVDSSGKMLSFLRRHPLPNLAAFQARAEHPDSIGEFDVVTGRALAPLSIQLEVSVRHAVRGGLLIPMRTPNDLAEIERLKKNPFGLTLERIETTLLRPLDVQRVFPLFRKIGADPKSFPRSWAEVRKKPY